MTTLKVNRRNQEDVPTMSSPYTTSSPARRTNGLAIASFVLSLVWLGGLGSVLAVIFGATAGRH